MTHRGNPPTDREQPVPVLERIELIEPFEHVAGAGLPSGNARTVVKGLERWVDVSLRLEAWVATAPSTVPVFGRLIGVPGDLLGATLGAWFDGTSARGEVDVDRWLLLGQPQRHADDEWSIAGRMHVHTCGRWLPVDVELWSHLDRWTYMTLEPRFHAHTSRLYFRRGNRSVDTFVQAVQTWVPVL
jgi:hypothetical protein